MITSIEKKIIFRYLKPKKRAGFINIISIFSFVGISLGVSILIIVMSVMNGFRSELMNKIIGFNAHLTIKPYNEEINIKKLNDENVKIILNNALISNSGEGIVINKDYTKGLLLRGYGQKSFKNLELVKNKNFVGNKKLNRKHISIGK